MVLGRMRLLASCFQLLLCKWRNELPAAPYQLPGCSVLPHVLYSALHMKHRESLPLTQGDSSVIPCCDLFSLMLRCGLPGRTPGKEFGSQRTQDSRGWFFFNGMGTGQRGNRGKYLKEKIRQSLVQFMKSVSC